MIGRTLTFASLLLAAAQPAFAAIPATGSQVVDAEAPPAAPPIAVTWNISVRGRVLVAELILVNTGSLTRDVVLANGQSPGPQVSAALDGAALEAVLAPAQKRELSSRGGPFPLAYGPLVAGERLVAGTYRFRLPAGFAGKTVHLEALVVGAFDHVVLPTTVVLPARGAV
jgi:uncharacterized membrane protein